MFILKQQVYCALIKTEKHDNVYEICEAVIMDISFVAVGILNALILP